MIMAVVRPTVESLERWLRDELSIPAGDDDRIAAAIRRAQQYVNAAIGASAERVDNETWSDCVITCAADLYNSRNARLGIMDANTDGVEPFRVPTDPLRAVWPKLNAVGVMCGGSVIA
ncbi:hypothetical protein PG2071B_1561 [Bifidobacterium pseudolongum subsp. globosum]|uniref:Phage gp6-like head-tail connector protein n=2 Tax=Bifidobacterium pseudolongum TaxID=1694 RepID=A0A4Q5A3D7_9BIFI|nr:hypothetical protein PG2071B_1561 [Bifidobacterium pseudolongum subsp. globosum]